MIVITVNRPGLDVIGVARGKPYLKKKGEKKEEAGLECAYSWKNSTYPAMGLA